MSLYKSPMEKIVYVVRDINEALERIYSKNLIRINGVPRITEKLVECEQELLDILRMKQTKKVDFRSSRKRSKLRSPDKKKVSKVVKKKTKVCRKSHPPKKEQTKPKPSEPTLPVGPPPIKRFIFPPVHKYTLRSISDGGKDDTTLHDPTGIAQVRGANFSRV